MKQYTIRPVEAADHERITSIYNHYIVNTIISFEEEIVSVEQMRRRIERVQTGYPYLVAEAEGIVVGYAYATHFRERHAYRFSTETTVYVDPQAIAAGCGTALYGELIADLKIRGFKMAIGGGVSLPNDASVRLHEKLGFEKIAHFSNVGRKFDKWVDVGFWQLQLTD